MFHAEIDGRFNDSNCSKSSHTDAFGFCGHPQWSHLTKRPFNDLDDDQNLSRVFAYGNRNFELMRSLWCAHELCWKLQTCRRWIRWWTVKRLQLFHVASHLNTVHINWITSWRSFLFPWTRFINFPCNLCCTKWKLYWDWWEIIVRHRP